MPKTFIDLFAGIGGFHWALKELGYECLLAVEKDEAAQKIYKLNFPKTKEHIEGDIRKITREDPEDEDTIRAKTGILKYLGEHHGIKAGEVGIICGGFPCQPFSKSGGQKGASDETRGTLFHDILQLTEALKPDYLILENVRNLAGPKHEGTLKTIIQRISKLGYEIDERPIVLSPHELKKKYGSPQVRERVFILAHRKGLKKAAHPVTVRDAVEKEKSRQLPNWKARNILEDGRSKTRVYKINPQEDTWLQAWEEFLRLTQSEKLPGFPIWTDVFQPAAPKLSGEPKWKQDFLRKNHEFYIRITASKSQKQKIEKWLKGIRKTRLVKGETVAIFPASRRKFEWQANDAFSGKSKRTLKKLLIQLRPSGIRVKPATHYPALVAITQTTIVGPKVRGKRFKDFRYITPKEAAKLQGMTKIKFGEQSDSLSYKQLGNAVNVGVIKFLAERLTGEVPCETP